jgi:hypothetical protein
MSVHTFACLSVRPSAWNNSAPTESIFTKFHISGFFENLSKKIKFPWNTKRITDILHEDPCTYTIYLAKSFLEWDISDTGCRENKNTHFVFSNSFFPRKSCHLWENVKKYDSQTGHRLQNKYGAEMHKYKHTLIIFNTYCSSTVTMVTRALLNVKLCVYCRSWNFLQAIK